MSGPDSTPLEHKATAPRSIGCWVLTVSDTKTPETDTSGQLIRKLLADAGHQVVGSEMCIRDRGFAVTTASAPVASTWLTLRCKRRVAISGSVRL